MGESKKKIAIIGVGGLAKVYAMRCRDLGIESHCFSWGKRNDDDAFDFYHEISITKTLEIVRVCKSLEISGVIPTTEATFLPAAKIASDLNLNGNPVEVAAVMSNKFHNREAVKNLECVKQPRYWRLEDVRDIQTVKFDYPAIVKPTSEAGKRGVAVLRNPDDLNSAIAYSESEPNRAHEVILEELLPWSPEYCVESLSFHGKNYIIQVTQKDIDNGPHCAELGHHQPAELPGYMRKRVETAIDAILTAVGIQNGPCCTEIRIVNNDIYFIELNARAGGDFVAYPLAELSTGYPYITGIIQAALDELEPIDTSKFESNYAGVCFITSQTANLKPLFDKCQDFDWCYEKHEVGNDLKALTHNDASKQNYFIYFSKEKRPVRPMLTWSSSENRPA